MPRPSRGCEFAVAGQPCGAAASTFEDRRLCDEHIETVLTQRGRLKFLYRVSEPERALNPAELDAAIRGLEMDLAEFRRVTCP